MEFHFATAWEATADHRGNRVAVVTDHRRTSWRDLEDRAARIAQVLADHGLGVDSKVGTYLHNSSEYIESQFAAFKIRGCPINVNYRYKAEELVYLLDNADAEAVVYQACYAMRIWEIRDQLPKVKVFIQVDDGTEALLEGAIDYETAITRSNPMPRIERPASDVYMLYTGGTTGMPKGVMYPGGEFCANLTGLGAMSRELAPPTSIEALPDYLASVPEPPVSLVACPLMHGTGMWLGAMVPMSAGGTVVLTSKLGLDPDLLWGLVEENAVTDMVIVGDAFARPLLGALDDAEKRGHAYDISSVQRITSSGVMWSSEIKQGLLRHHDMILQDIMGSSEGGMGSSITNREGAAKTAKFQLNDGVAVFTDDGRRVEPGSGEIGKIATSGSVPIGYYKDPVKSAETFKEIDGVRYSFPGDYAQVEADGSITLLGRGSVCINTAGEKVFPEEVEEAVKLHPAVLDCLVVGVPDERFGERVVAVASYQAGESCEESAVIEFTREHLAGYKLPKHVLFVDQVQRAPNGKADYKWAKRAVEAAYGDGR
ncbi:MAG: acyl-CoA synthetase [Gammaproteobacteria bacterium]|nr:MAG: acyl-CoA synthetase [Gammaproteobacteria bacterium]